jgi:hypothetical protein
MEGPGKLASPSRTLAFCPSTVGDQRCRVVTGWRQQGCRLSRTRGFRTVGGKRHNILVTEGRSPGLRRRCQALGPFGIHAVVPAGTYEVERRNLNTAGCDGPLALERSPGSNATSLFPHPGPTAMHPMAGGMCSRRDTGHPTASRSSRSLRPPQRPPGTCLLWWPGCDARDRILEVISSGISGLSGELFCLISRNWIGPSTLLEQVDMQEYDD